MPRLRKLHSLKRPKIRQDWSKYTLYNLSRMQTPPAVSKTYFQQKWIAKSLTRAFHNPYVREGKWTRMFDRRLPSVVPMDHKYLARYDGSERAAGRGSGLDTGRDRSRNDSKTPYMHMTFHPLERRLDTAIWRAMFASSARQARQFVVHGAVKVNGKKMIHPSYQLNPGDMFSVDPERVLYATGARKLRKASHVSGQHERDAEEQKREKEEMEQEMEREMQEKKVDDAAEDFELLKIAPDVISDDKQDPRTAMKSLMARAKKISLESKRQLSAKRQQELREFARSVKTTLSKHPRKAEATDSTDGKSTVRQALDGLEQTLAEILVKIPSDQLSKGESQKADDAAGKVDPKKAKREMEQLKLALESARIARELDEENPIDKSKPYATPWRPRDYMSAFAFIPRYLEVNHNICSAVYLRHPVARPGLSEVPTPFSEETMQLAFNWYLRRR